MIRQPENVFVYLLQPIFRLPQPITRTNHKAPTHFQAAANLDYPHPFPHLPATSNPIHKTMHTIQDYLQTQALRLNPEAIAIARAATQAIIAHGQAHIDRSILLPSHLAPTFAHQPQAEAQLKQLYMALDSAHSQHPSQTTALYGNHTPSQTLIRLIQHGAPIEDTLPLNEHHYWQHLAARTAQSGWAQIAPSTEQWLANGELKGTHNRRSTSQTSLPISNEDGIVYGVLHLETPAPLSDDQLAHWIGVALGIHPILSQLLPQAPSEEQ